MERGPAVSRRDVCATLLFGSLITVTPAVSFAAVATTVMDFQLAPVGPFTGPLVVPDGLGGAFTLTPAGHSGSSYEIVDESGDRELRLSDVGSTPGSFLVRITHSLGNFTQISGGEYEALPGLAGGEFIYQRLTVTIFSDTNPISTVESTPITFGTQVPTSEARFRGNGSFSASTDISVDFDDLQFEVNILAVPSMTNWGLLGTGLLLLGVASAALRFGRRTR